MMIDIYDSIYLRRYFLFIFSFKISEMSSFFIFFEDICVYTEFKIFTLIQRKEGVSFKESIRGFLYKISLKIIYIIYLRTIVPSFITAFRSLYIPAFIRCLPIRVAFKNKHMRVRVHNGETLQ